MTGVTYRDLLDDDYDPAEYEQKIGEGWTHDQIVADAISRGIFEVS